jgi:catechol 2,3-dioxygenase-like lactoylglutathione lyase family enzyme
MTGSPSGAPDASFGFDHVVVAVRDLPDAVARYTALGFRVEPGGRHPGFGTVNALIRFENGYVELLAVEDTAVARRAGVRRREVVEYLDQRPGGLIGYAFTCDSLERVRLRAGRADPRLDGPPLEMSRIRPDGSTLRWRLLVPGGSTWCRPWPFLIEWEASDRPSTPGASGLHPNGAFAIDGLILGTTSLARVSAFFEENLGLALRSLPGSDRDAQPGAAVNVGGCRIEFVDSPDDAPPGPLPSTVDGEGPVELRIRVSSLDPVSDLLAARGIRLADRGPHLLRVEPNAAAGARLALVDG